MSSIRERIGGYRRYAGPAAAALIGIAILYWPGSIGTDAPRRLFILIGAALSVGAVGWIFMLLDRHVSDDPRYQRPVYTEDEDSDPEA